MLPIKHRYVLFAGPRAGFETTSYTVSEGVGSQEVCVRMFDLPNTHITRTFRIAVETVAGTAGE